MKTRIITVVCLFGISSMLCHEAIAQREAIDRSAPRPFYASLAAQLSIPQGALKEFSSARGGFRIEVGRPFRRIPWLSGGFELSGVFSSPKKDTFKGLEVKTKSEQYSLHYFLRWTPVKTRTLKPYIDSSFGFTMASTETTSTIVDNATFLEEVLFNKQTEVETTTHASNISTNVSFSIGAGVIIVKRLMVGVRYRHTNPVDYADKNSVYVKDNTLQYDEKHIPLDIIEVTIGVTNWGSH